MKLNRPDVLTSRLRLVYWRLSVRHWRAVMWCEQGLKLSELCIVTSRTPMCASHDQDRFLFFFLALNIKGSYWMTTWRSWKQYPLFADHHWFSRRRWHNTSLVPHFNRAVLQFPDQKRRSVGKSQISFCSLVFGINGSHRSRTTDDHNVQTCPSSIPLHHVMETPL